MRTRALIEATELTSNVNLSDFNINLCLAGVLLLRTGYMRKVANLKVVS